MDRITNPNLHHLINRAMTAMTVMRMKMVKKRERKKKRMILPTARGCTSARTAVHGVIGPLRPTCAAFRYHMHGHHGLDQCQGQP